MQWAAAQLPHFTIVSRFFPNTWNINGKQGHRQKQQTCWAKKPPTKASPAPLVSTISSLNMAHCYFKLWQGSSLPWVWQRRGRSAACHAQQRWLGRSPGWSPQVCCGCRSPVKDTLHVVQLVLICSLDNLGQLSDLHGDFADVGGVETEALRIGGGLSLVAEDYVGEWQHGGHLVLEELERQNEEGRTRSLWWTWQRKGAERLRQ